jgi:hypothetical protein
MCAKLAFRLAITLDFIKKWLFLEEIKAKLGIQKKALTVRGANFFRSFLVLC